MNNFSFSNDLIVDATKACCFYNYYSRLLLLGVRSWECNRLWRLERNELSPICMRAKRRQLRTTLKYRLDIEIDGKAELCRSHKQLVGNSNA